MAVPERHRNTPSEHAQHAPFRQLGQSVYAEVDWGMHFFVFVAVSNTPCNLQYGFQRRLSEDI